MSKKTTAGFTLIELTVVIAIIGMIMAISFVAFTDARQKARNAKRVSDITQVQNTLSLYRRDEGEYPSALTFGSQFTGSSSEKVYMNTLPQNPDPKNDGDCPDSNYAYASMAAGASYQIDFCLSKPTGKLDSGPKCATPQGILNRSCFVCGVDKVTITNIAGHVCDTNAPYYDTCVYDTIYIDEDGGHDTRLEGQCWMTKNLNIGKIVDGNTNQTNNSPSPILEKYCYDPDGILSDHTYCQSEGGLYQWNEAMQYTTSEPNQGICPTGWHIPRDSELHYLENNLKNFAQSCDGNRTFWGCAGAATRLKVGGSSNFEARLSGNRSISGPTFEVVNMYGCYWSSTLNSASTAWDRLLYDFDSLARLNHDTNTGFSIRCLKD